MAQELRETIYLSFDDIKNMYDEEYGDPVKDTLMEYATEFGWAAAATILKKCIGSALFAVLEPLGFAITLVQVTNSIKNAIEKEKIKEMYRQMDSYGGIGAMEVKTVTRYEMIEVGGVDPYFKIYDTRIESFRYLRNG